MNTTQTYKMKENTTEHGDNKAKSTPIGGYNINKQLDLNYIE